MEKKSKKKRTIKTVSLQRQLLKYLLKDKIYLRRMYGLCKNEWFTNQSRMFIYTKIMSYFEDNKSILTRQQFEYELDKHFDEEDDEYKIKEYMTQFDICSKLESTQTLQLIISKLNEVDLATDVNHLIVTAYQKLQQGQIDEAASMLKSGSLDLSRTEHKGRILNLHEDVDDWVTQIVNRKQKPQRYTGIPTGFPTFDKKTGGLFKAQLTVIFGLSGKGKSTVMKSIASNVRKAGFNVLHCGNQQNQFQMRTKYQALQSGIPYSRFKNGNFTDEQFERWQQFNLQQRTKGGGLYIYEFPQSTDATLIERAVSELSLKGIHIDLIVVDYMDLMAPTHRAYSQNDEMGKVTKDLKGLAISCDCPVLTCTQAGSQVQKQQTKERPFLNASDVFGTKQKVHSANCLIGIVNQTATVGVGEKTEEERKIHKLVICVPKNRDGGIFSFRCDMHVTIGKVVQNLQKDVVGEQIQRQAMQMIDQTNPSGQMRSTIDMKKIVEQSNKQHLTKIQNIVNSLEKKEETNNISLKDQMKKRNEAKSPLSRWKSKQ